MEMKEEVEMEEEVYFIGTGPSLKDIDVSKFKDKYTLSFNRSYIAYDEWGFCPTYYVLIDPNLIKSIAEDINQLSLKYPNSKFFIRQTDKKIHGIDTSELIKKRDNVTIFDVGDVRNGFRDSFPISSFGTVGLCSLQIVKMMGHNKIYLFGNDLNYKTDVPNTNKSGKSLISTANSDVNHFSNEYFGKNIQYGKPTNNVRGRWDNFMIKTYPKLNERDGFELILCTKGSYLIKYLELDSETLKKFQKKQI